MSSNWRHDGSRPVEDAIRAALRADGLLVPQTVEEVARFEAEQAWNPIDVPAHLLAPEWLFGTVGPKCNSDTPKSLGTGPRPNVATAARDGTEIPSDVASRMHEDRIRHEAEVGVRATTHKHTNRELNEFGSDSRMQEIADLAEWIARENCASGILGVTAIASRRSIGISFNDYEDAFDGLLEHDAGRFHIYCNLRRVESHDSDRARFTLSHELAHFFIDAHRQMLERGESLPLSQCDYESAAPIEREADHFAAHLLMPSERFVRQARGMNPGLPAILSLRKQFGTSVTSTACRYATLGIAPCVVVKWSRSGVAWTFMSKSAREAGLWKTIQSAAHLPADSPTAKVLAGNAPPTKGFFEAGTTTSFWFPGVAQGSFRNELLIEQAISLGRFGALTVLFPECGRFPQSV